MKSLSRFLCSGVATFILATLISRSDAFGQRTALDHKIDIEVIDRALANAKPGDPWVKFGDVGIKSADLEVYRERLAGKNESTDSDVVTPPGTTFKWPAGNVYYRFDPTQGPGTITPAKMQAFRDGVAEWAAFANLTFIEFTGTPPANYITVQQQASGEGGFSSSVGMAGGQQFIQIGPNSWNRGTICHEVGHAIGLWHEQQRDDRDTYVVIHFENINPGDQGNFAMIVGGTTAIGAYDFYSIMHYSRNALSNNGQDTITMRPAYAQYLDIIGTVFDRILSKLDRTGMAVIYGNPSPLPSAIVTNTKDSGRGSLRTSLYYAFDKSTDVPPVATAVTFNIPMSDPNFSGGVFTIKPTYALVAPGAGTTIDAATQTAFTGDTNPSGPEVVLDGSQVGAQSLSLFASGFRLREANCTIKNLVINGFNQQGIVIDGTAAALNGTSAAGNVISGCYIGTDKTGSAAVANTFPGIELFGGAHNNTIGGTTAAARNVISGNAHHGIVIQGAGSNNNLIAGNYIGTNAAGTGALANTFTGVAIFGGAQTNIIGGTSAGARNVLSGNKRQGFIFADSGTNGNTALGNYIGLNATGTATVANGFEDPVNHFFYPGAAIFNGAKNNIIGGTAAGSANVISGNAAQGVDIADAGTTGNSVLGNFIGTNPAGTSALGNGFADPPNFYLFAGIAIFGGAQSNVIGGTAAGASNLISGNGAQGVAIVDPGTSANLVQGNFIGTNAAGTGALANGYSGVGIFGGASSNTIGGTSTNTRNLISGNSNQGLIIANPGTNLNLVQGNYIGVNAAGAAALPNAFEGIAIFDGAQTNTIGGTATGARNIISGNGDRGISIGQPNTNSNVVQSNYIGVDATGTSALGNGSVGISIYDGAQSNNIGGSTSNAGNVISGNFYQGVTIDGPGTTQNFVQGNFVGVDKNGTVARANGSTGISIYNDAHDNTIGGTAAGARNIISGNAFQGLTLSESGTTGNLIRGNYFGLDATGLTKIANGSTGVELFSGAHDNVIGGTAPGSRNFICGSTFYGVALSQSGTNSNLVQGNTIGLNVAGTAIGNGSGFAGVGLFNGAQSNMIGGSTTGAGNVIAANATGVALYDATTIGNAILSNSIFSNNALGIDLNGDGVTLNDNCDGDSGPNNLENFPVLTSASFAGGSVTLSGMLNSTASTTFRLEFFSNAMCDSSGNGEGQVFLGSAIVTTAVNCQTSFGPLNFSFAAGQTSVTSTATDPNGNTSEFSSCVQVTGAPTPTPTPLPTPTPSPTATATATIPPTPTPTASAFPRGISGTVVYCSNPVPGPVPNVTMTLTGTTSGATLTDASGNYSFTNLPSGGNYTVTPTKAARTPGSANINTVDVIAVQKQFLTGTFLSGCKLTAADVNGDTVVNTQDVIAVQRFFNGQTTAIANVGKYKFTPVNRTYTNLLFNQTAQNYDTLVFGDVAAGFVELADGPSPTVPADGTSADEVAATVAAVALPEVAVDQTMSNFIARVTATDIDAKNKLVGFQGDLTFDERVVTCQSEPVQKAGLTGGNWNVSGNILPGTGPIRTLRISAYSNDFTPLSGSGTLLELRMTRVGAPAHNTQLIWAAAPDHFIFIDADLKTQKPGYPASGGVTFTSSVRQGR